MIEDFEKRSAFAREALKETGKFNTRFYRDVHIMIDEHEEGILISAATFDDAYAEYLWEWNVMGRTLMTARLTLDAILDHLAHILDAHVDGDTKIQLMEQGRLRRGGNREGV